MAKVFSIIAISFAALIAVGYFLTVSGGKPIGTDLSVVGQGKPALVLAYENHSPAGGDALNRLRNIRSDYDSRLNFAVADLGTPLGQQFADTYKLVDGLAVLLSSNGELIEVNSVAENEAELRRYLDAKLQP